MYSSPWNLLVVYTVMQLEVEKSAGRREGDWFEQFMCEAFLKNDYFDKENSHLNVVDAHK